MLAKTLMLLAATVVSAETQNLRSVADLDAGSSKSKSIWDRLQRDPELSTLVTALKAADLVDTLSGTGPFTVLAPTNQAFANVPAGTLAALLKPQNKAELVDLLTYHVLPGVVPFKTDGEGACGVPPNNARALTANRAHTRGNAWRRAAAPPPIAPRKHAPVA